MFSYPSMAQSTGTAEDVLRQAVSALAANDQPALNKLSINQSEFKKYVWPGLAAQMSGSNSRADQDPRAEQENLIPKLAGRLCVDQEVHRGFPCGRPCLGERFASPTRSHPPNCPPLSFLVDCPPGDSLHTWRC